MLPALLYPLLIPVLIAAMQMTTALLGTEHYSIAGDAELRLLVVFDLIYTSLALFLMEFILVL